MTEREGEKDPLNSSWLWSGLDKAASANAGGRMTREPKCSRYNARKPVHADVDTTSTSAQHKRFTDQYTGMDIVTCYSSSEDMTDMYN